MSDERLRAAVRSSQELSMTDAAFDGLRIAMVNRLIATEYPDAAEREHLYHGLKALDMVRETLKAAVKSGASSKAMDEHAAQFAAGAKVAA